MLPNVPWSKPMAFQHFPLFISFVFFCSVFCIFWMSLLPLAAYYCVWQLICVSMREGEKDAVFLFALPVSVIHFFYPVKQTKSWNARRMLTACRDSKQHKHEREKNVWFLPHTWLIYHCGGALSDIIERHLAGKSSILFFFLLLFISDATCIHVPYVFK